MSEHDPRHDPSAPWPRAGSGAGSPEPAAVDTLARTADPESESDHDAAAPPEHPDAMAQAWMAGGAGTGESRYSSLRLLLVVLAVVAGTIFFGPYVFIIIGGLLVSIILHEFGHYWTARRCGMKVTEFFVGFGPRIWSFRRGETEYGLKPIPAGAYVKIIGMNDFEEVDPADEPRTYRAQSAPKRIAVVVAGPAMNLLIFFVLMVAVFMGSGPPTPDNWTETRTDWTIKGVQEGSAAEAAGVQAGDKILSVAGDPVTTFDRFREQIDAKAGQRVDVVVQRDGREVVLTPTLGWRLDKDTAKAIASQPALLTGDVIASANGQRLATYGDLRTVLGQPGDPVTLSIERGGYDYELLVPRPLALPEDGAAGYLGVGPDVPQVKETFVGALGETGRFAVFATTATASGLGRLFSPQGASEYVGQFSPTDTTVANAPAEPSVLRPVGNAPPADQAPLSESVRPISIVGIVQVGSGAAEQGIWAFLSLLAIVNLSLALINLLPVLPFDGGHASIAAYEGIRGSIRHERYRADLTKMMPIVYGVFGVLILLAASSVLLDIMKPVTGGP